MDLMHVLLRECALHIVAKCSRMRGCGEYPGADSTFPFTRRRARRVRLRVDQQDMHVQAHTAIAVRESVCPNAFGPPKCGFVRQPLPIVQDLFAGLIT